ncbi:hypothetical protein [Trinickia terrae]|nr:hypothetical protein [Trinickia terrae]
MRQGIGLSHDGREPWLDRLSALMDERGGASAGDEWVSKVEK